MKTQSFTWMVALAATMILFVGCKDEATISGKSTGTWIAKLNNLDPKVQSDAIQALNKAPQPVIEAATPRLLEIASKGTGVSSEAAILLATSTAMARPEFATLYLRPKHMTHGIPEEGGFAMMILYFDYPEIAEKETRRRLAEATDPADTEMLKQLLLSMKTEQPDDSPDDSRSGSDDRDRAQDNRGYYDQ